MKKILLYIILCILFLNSVLANDIIQDDFTRTNGDLNGDTATNGKTWVADTQYQVLSNEMKAIITANTQEAYLNFSETYTDMANKSFSFDIKLVDSNAYRPIFLFRDSSDNLVIQFVMGSSPNAVSDAVTLYDGGWITVCSNCLTDNTWSNIQIVNISLSSDTHDVIVDGTLYDNGGSHYGFQNTAINLDNIKIDSYDNPTYYLDNFKIINITAILNSEPNVSVTFTNNTHIHNNQTYFNGTYTDSDGDNGNCTLLINGSNYGTQSLSNGSSVSIQNNVELVDGIYNWKFQCYDNNSNEYNTTLYNFVVDTINPYWTIRTINTDNTTKFDREIVSNITFNDSLYDTYIFGYKISGYYPNGSLWFNDSQINLTTTSFNYTQVKNITANMPNGTYSINYYGEDDHTANEIKEYTNSKKTEGFLFETETATIGVYSKDFKQLTNYEAIKSLDRYSFNFEYNNDKKTRTYVLRSSKVIYERSNLYPFPSFVTGKHWIDFNTDNLESYVVNRINPSEIEIEITEKKSNSKTIFKSLGGLNSVNETYNFQIASNQAPNIDFTSPNQSISVYDGYNQSFYMNGTDFDNDTLNYKYYYDGVLKSTSQNYTFFAPYNSHGEHNITGVLNDGSTKSDSYYWNVTIVNLNRPPITTSLVRTPLTTWYENINAELFCTGYDVDNETQPINWSVEIQYKSGLLWQDLTETYYNNQTWNASIDLTGLAGETLSFRCRINDGFEWSDYIILTDEVTIQEAYTQVGNATIIPSGTTKDYGIKVNCRPESIGTINRNALIYDIDSYYSGSWHNLSYGLMEDTTFSMANVDYGENVTFRCKIDDGVTPTEYTIGDKVTRQKSDYFFMFNMGSDEVERSNKPYVKGLMVDFSTQYNISINATFVDCNNDGYYDYYFKYDEKINKTKEYFTCINKNGIIPHTIGVLIDKQGSNDLFCGNKENGYCIIKKTYEVIVK